MLMFEGSEGLAAGFPNAPRLAREGKLFRVEFDVGGIDLEYIKKFVREGSVWVIGVPGSDPHFLPRIWLSGCKRIRLDGLEYDGMVAEYQALTAWFADEPVVKSY